MGDPTTIEDAIVDDAEHVVRPDDIPGRRDDGSGHDGRNSRGGATGGGRLRRTRRLGVRRQRRGEQQRGDAHE